MAKSSIKFELKTITIDNLSSQFYSFEHGEPKSWLFFPRDLVRVKDHGTGEEDSEKLWSIQDVEAENSNILLSCAVGKDKKTLCVKKDQVQHLDHFEVHIFYVFSKQNQQFHKIKSC